AAAFRVKPILNGLGATAAGGLVTGTSGAVGWAMSQGERSPQGAVASKSVMLFPPDSSMTETESHFNLRVSGAGDTGQAPEAQTSSSPVSVTSIPTSSARALYSSKETRS